MARSSNFTNRQKAELYVMHRATCTYSGDNLWIIDDGVHGWTIDWADHIIPVSRGGTSTLENGVCAAWWYNQSKSDALTAPPFLFFKGAPTKHYVRAHGRLPRVAARRLARLAHLHHSDWYFNRALFRALLGVRWLHDGVGTRSRDDLYYARAALKAITEWHSFVRRDAVCTLEQRDLAPRRPSADQALLLRIRDSTSVDSIRALMRQLLPHFAKNAHT